MDTTAVIAGAQNRQVTRFGQFGRLTQKPKVNECFFIIFFFLPFCPTRISKNKDDQLPISFVKISVEILLKRGAPRGRSFKVGSAAAIHGGVDT